jgi:fructokinase
LFVLEKYFTIFSYSQRNWRCTAERSLASCSLGLSAKIISRVGRDPLGTELLVYAAINGVDTDAIQRDDLSTGEVIVDLNETGSATH